MRSRAGKDRVTFVEVADLGTDAEGLERPHAADAQHQFLGQPLLAASPVEFVGDALSGRVVLGQRGVEQVERDAAHLHLPDLGPHPPSPHIDVNGQVRVTVPAPAPGPGPRAAP